MNIELLDLIIKAIDLAKDESNQELLLKLNQAKEILEADVETEPVVEVVTSQQFSSIDQSLFSPEGKVLLNLLQSDDWPEAVPDFLICSDTEDDKLERAEGILDYIGVDYQNKKVLDFGCGEGHVSLKVSEFSSDSLGYDIKSSGVLSWEQDGRYLLTTDFSKVESYGPYDLVILYDVLDHCEDPVALLKQVKSVCRPTTEIFVRCHSFMSRHGGHLYRQLNKAWVHFFFTAEELSLMGLESDIVQKCYFPIANQKKWFKSAELNIKSEDIIKGIVEDFFKKEEFKPRIKNIYKGDFPEWQMSQSFNDYVLTLQ